MKEEKCIKGHPMVLIKGELCCLVCDMEKDLLGIQFPEYKKIVPKGTKWKRKSLIAARQIQRALNRL